MNSMDIPAQPTVYTFGRFRSRLEADWAATLDSLSIQWEYETRPLVLPSGTPYLPDFFLPEIGTWVEVKAHDGPRLEKAHELAEHVACKCQGTCTCEWPGGEIVLIGYPAARVSGLRHGAAHWEDARFSSLLMQCPACLGRSWVRPRFSLQCRKCGVLNTGHLAGIGDVPFMHVKRSETS